MSLLKKIREQGKDIIYATGQHPDTIILTPQAAADLIYELGHISMPGRLVTELPITLYGMRPTIIEDVVVAQTGRKDVSQ